MAIAELVDAQTDEAGRSWQLFRRGEAYEVHLDGRRLCATDQPRNERELVDLVMAPLQGRDDITVIIAGLGCGRTVRAVLDRPGVKRVDVIEASPQMIEWEKGYFAGSNGDALKDPRVKLHKGELLQLLKQVRLGMPGVLPEEGAFALLLDTDEGPGVLSRKGNETHYTDEGIERLEGALRPGGVLVMWSSKREPDLSRLFASRLQNVAEVVVPVDLPDGTSSLDYVYRGRRPAAERARPQAAGGKPAN